MSISLRPINEPDMEEILDAERNSNLIDDPFLGKVLYPWTMEAKEIIEFIKQIKDKKTGTNDTCVYSAVTRLDNGIPWVCGAMGFENSESAFIVKILIIHPKADIPAVFDTFVKKLVRMASKKNKKVIFHLRDHDSCRLNVYIPMLQKAGFSVRLARNYFSRMQDGWLCELTTNLVRK